jgi:hypothetical protein
MTRPSALVSSENVDSYGRRGEAPLRGIVAHLDRLGGGGVGDDLPRGRGGHGEGELGLEVGLLEHREDAARVGHLELRVEVHLAVDRVDEAVQALAGVGVLAVRVDDELVLRGQSLERDARVGEDLGGVEDPAVEGHRVHGARDEVDEGRRALGRGEPDGGHRAKHLVAAQQIEAHVVSVRVDDRAALLRFDAGEVLSWHWRSPEDVGGSSRMALLAPTTTV